ncbi:MAG: diaminopimelate epimerase [Gaiellaceae bacterium]
MRFSKWHALGNSYLLVERAEVGRPLTPERAQALCDPRTGAGADGVLEVLSADDDRAEIEIWNPDGSTAELSGNGLRIVARWLSERSGADEVRVRVGAREVTARVRGEVVELDVGAVEVGELEELTVGGERLEVTAVSVGNPHAVVRREPSRDDLLRLGPALERHARFPERTNVQLVRVDGLHDLTVAVWERGAGETASSGTSAVAATAAAVANGWCESPVTVHLRGGDLLVELDAENRATLTGPAVEILRGELVGEA